MHHVCVSANASKQSQMNMFEESEEDSLPNPAQWLAMLGEEGDEETE